MIAAFDVLRDLSFLSMLFRFLMACLFGGIIGLERGRRQQAAGLRTHMMVCIGAASTMIVGEYMVLHAGRGDLLRLGAQVISGIGFLGAGSIIVTKQNRIKGLTTAASLWASACMGLAIGSGFYECALAMMFVMLFVLLVMGVLDSKYVKATAHVSLYIEMEKGFPFGLIIEDLRNQGWSVQEVRQLDYLVQEQLALRVDLMSEDMVTKPVLSLDALMANEGIHVIETM